MEILKHLQAKDLRLKLLQLRRSLRRYRYTITDNFQIITRSPTEELNA